MTPTVPAAPSPSHPAPPVFEPTPWLEQHPLPHWLYEHDSQRLRWANTAALARYGYDLAEFTTLTREQLLMPEERERAAAFLAALPASAARLPQPVWRERHRDGHALFSDIRGTEVLYQGRPARLLVVGDASQREAMLQESQRARELAQVAGRVARIGGWSLDLRERVVTWSDEVCALHEVPPGSRCGLDEAVRFYPDGAAEQVGEALRRCIEGEQTMDLVLPFVGARGTRRWVRVVGEAVRDATGEAIAVQGAQQDITEARVDQLALEDSRGQLAALLAAIPDLWMVIDRELRYEQVSHEQHPGLSAPWSEKLGRPVAATTSAELASEVAALCARAHASGQPQLHHYDLVVMGGERRWFEARYVAMNQGRTLALIRDLTSTRELERRFQALAQAAPMGIFIADNGGDISYANPTWLALFGLQDQPVPGRAWAPALHPDDLDRVAGGWQQYAASQGLFEMEFRLAARADSPERRVWAQARPLRAGEGRSGEHVGCVVDITAARELQREREARAVAEETGRRQAAFLSRVSHELRTPLNAILGFGQLLQPDLTASPRQAGYIGHIVKAGQHMLALVDDLLQLQRIEQGRFEPQRAPLRAVLLLETVVQMLGPMAQAAGVTLRGEADEGLVLDSDERCLRQILLNLGSNAVKYGRRGGQVVLAARAQAAGFVIEVRDDGPGMDEAQLARLFRPFDRLGQESSTVAGSGLGLVISRQLAQALGGTLQISSRPGEGTCATLQVPAAPA